MRVRQPFHYLRNGFLRKPIAILRSRLRGRRLSDLAGDELFDAYHEWFYTTGIPFRLTWEGVPAIKSPLDMWNYQQIIWELQPTIVIEFGTNRGGSALFFSRILDAMGGQRRVLTVDVEQGQVDPRVFERPNISFIHASTSSVEVAQAISRLRSEISGPVFAILDSDHSRDHVLEELRSITPLLAPGDRLVVEDTNINGRPVLAGWGPGPHEALEEFLADFPDSYTSDDTAASLFGWSFAPGGFLIRV